MKFSSFFKISNIVCQDTNVKAKLSARLPRKQNKWGIEWKIRRLCARNYYFSFGEYNLCRGAMREEKINDLSYRLFYKFEEYILLPADNALPVRKAETENRTEVLPYTLPLTEYRKNIFNKRSTFNHIKFGRPNHAFCDLGKITMTVSNDITTTYILSLSLGQWVGKTFS